MGSNYPPGVTGAEYAIAGPDIETFMLHEVCEGCGNQGMTLVTYRHDAWLACDECSAQRDYELEDTRDPDTRDR